MHIPSQQVNSFAEHLATIKFLSADEGYKIKLVFRKNGTFHLQ